MLLKFNWIVFLTVSLYKAGLAGVVLTNLQTEYQPTPLGMDILNPHFSWQMKANDSRRGYFQKAFQLIVLDPNHEEVWNTGKKNTSLSHSIEYQGKALRPTTRYTWKVMVWNNQDQMSVDSSWFETGLLNPSITAWSGAKWIGGGDDDLVLHAHYLSVFKFEYTVRLDRISKTTRAGFLIGGNDRRLMNKNLNLMQVENKLNESYIQFELDIAGLDTPGQPARLVIYRAGYHANDNADIPILTLDIPAHLINNANKYEPHSFLVECNFGLFTIYVDEKKKENILADKNAPAPGPFATPGINLNPIGRGNNFISFPMLGDIGFCTQPGQIAYFSNIKIKNYRYPSNVLFSENLNTSYDGIFKNQKISIEKNEFKIQENSKILSDPSKNAAPMLRTVFNTPSKKIKSAKMYVTARGIYEIFINGKRISNDYFNPGLTQYNKTLMYQTYDITSSIQSGADNAIGAWLSEGWWSGNSTYSGESWNFFGDRQSLLSKLVITYQDGKEQIIVSDPDTWKLFTDGPLRYGSFFQGEVYDATKDALIRGWSMAYYRDDHWKSAAEVPLEGTACIGDFTDPLGRKVSMDYSDFKILGQIGKNASIVKKMIPISVNEVRPKVFVYDMGQNMVGVPKIKIENGKKGQIITLRYAEMKYPDLKAYQSQTGMIMMENIRAALSTDTYILKGGMEVIQPRFTFHGFRYLEITGIDKVIPLTDVTGLVISSIDQLSSSYTSSNPLVNKLWQNITWSLRSNFLSIPTDTPARNERMGWSGDISVFSRSATYLANTYLFLRRHLLAMRDVQAANGRFTDVAPMGGGFGGTLWGSAGITVAWEIYMQYGETEILKEHYGAMKKYIHFLESKMDKNTGILNEGPLGDWLSPEGTKNDNTLFWMAYFAYDLSIMHKVALALQHSEDANYFLRKQNEIKNAFNEIYIDKITHQTIKSGTKTGFMGPPNQQSVDQKTDKGQLIHTQASYAIPLALDVFDSINKPYAIQYLKETIARATTDDESKERPAYSLMTGFIGTASISEALSENGLHDIAYRLLQQTTYPSWLYSVVNGATTIWERLNSYTLDNGFGDNNSMNSFNHYSFGSVAAWMYNYSLGIQRNPLYPGFKEFILKPQPDPDKKMKWAKGYCETRYGKIQSEWSLGRGMWKYKTTVPENTSACLYLPAKSVKDIMEGKINVLANKSITEVVYSNGYVKMKLPSGKYDFEIKE